MGVRRTQRERSGGARGEFEHTPSTPPIDETHCPSVRRARAAVPAAHSGIFVCPDAGDTTGPS